jgi:hypothetical protein
MNMYIFIYLFTVEDKSQILHMFFLYKNFLLLK